MNIFIVADIAEDSERGITGDYIIGTGWKTLEKAQAEAIEDAKRRYGRYKNLEFSWAPDPKDEHATILSVAYDTGWEVCDPVRGGIRVPYGAGTVAVPAWRPTGVARRETEQYCAVVTVEVHE